MDSQPSPVKPDSPSSEPTSTSQENLTPSLTSTPPLVQPQNVQPSQNPTFSPPQQTPTFISQADKNAAAVEHSKRKFLLPLMLAVIVILAIVGVFIFKGSHTTPKLDGSTKASYLSENYTISIVDNNDYALNNPYGLGVSFNDSWNPKPTCPSKQPGFAGKITVTNMTESGASFTITQNKKPYTLTPNNHLPLCGTGTAVVPTDSTQYTFSNAWLENGPAFKTLTIQGKRYTLHVDKTNYKLTLTNGSIITGTTFFPENIGSLHSDPPNCMSVAQLQAYAQKNGMEIAEDRYPGLDQVLETVPGVTVVSPSDEQILVIINSSYIKLAQQTSQKEACQIWTGVGDISGTPYIIGNHIDNITVGSENE